MSIFEAILLGIIQGVTEFFPISSSGHLIIAEQLLGVETDYGVLFNVVLHIGTLVAVFFAFRKDVLRLLYSYIGIVHDIMRNLITFIDNLVYKQNKKYRKILKSQYRKLAVLVLWANIPTALIGYCLSGLVSGLSKSLLAAGLGLLVTGLLVFVTGFVDRGYKKPRNTSWYSAMLIGACQGLSVMPGISRFGTTMSVELLSGFNRLFALKFSFLISMPAIIGAAVLELFRLPENSGITFGFVICCMLSAITAALVGIFTIKALMWILKKNKFRFFSYYCFAVGILVILLNYLV